ncbi:hypothetical protein JCM1840_004042 [Sporobolomyces johnsonii]
MLTHRPPPCLSVYIPGASGHSHTRSSSAPAFGIISTYSQRVPRSRSALAKVPPADQTRKQEEGRPSMSSSDGSEDDFELEKVTVAQVSSQPRLKPVNISLGLQPPTPDVHSLPTPEPAQRRHAHSDDASTRSLKQQRRTASIYSNTSVVGDPTSRPNSAYLSSDGGLFSHSNLSAESLALPAPQPVDSSSGTFSSPPSVSASRPSPSIAPSYRSDAGHSAPPSLAPSSSTTSLVPVPAAPLPAYSARQALGEGPSGRPETAADRLKRLYLCPWDAVSPRSYLRERSNSGSRTTTAQERARASDPEKGLNADADGHVESAAEGGRSRVQRSRVRLFTNLVVLLCVAALVADLIVLNVRSFRREDWE